MPNRAAPTFKEMSRLNPDLVARTPAMLIAPYKHLIKYNIILNQNTGNIQLNPNSQYWNCCA